MHGYKVDHIEEHSHLPDRMVTSPGASNHIHEILNYSESREQCTVHPSSPLFDKNREIWGSICECLGVGDIGQIVAVVFFDIDLQAHDSIFSKVLIGLGTRRIFVTVDQLEELIHRATLDGSPSEQGVCSRQNGVVSEETFAALVGRVTQLVLVELGGLDNI